MKLLPTTIEGWTKKKERFIALLEKEQPWTHMADVYENAINYCDRKMLELKGMYRKVLLMVVLLACLILSIGGCNAIDGARQDIHQWTDTPAHHK